MNNSKILIVEDDKLLAEYLKLKLNNQGYQVVGTLDSAEAAIEQITALAPQLVLMDIMLQGPMDGIEASQIIKDKHNIPVLYLTAHCDVEMLKRAKVTEPSAYIVKPFNDDDLLASIKSALA